MKPKKVNHPAPLPAPLPMPALARLKVIKGPHKGASYKLVAGKISLGRSSENDIVLMNDDKCSRKQALVSLREGGGYIIKDLSNKSSVKINNVIKLQSDLQDGDLIQFGSTVLQFTAPPAGAPAGFPLPGGGPQQQAPVPLPLAPLGAGEAPVDPVPPPVLGQAGALPGLKPGNESPADPYPPQMDVPGASYPSGKNQKAKKKHAPKIILAVLVLGGIGLFLTDTEQKTEEDRLRTKAQREEGLKTLTDLKEKEWEKRSKNAQSSYRHAQFAYTKGIRDYRKGVYNRAIESFRVCKTLYPQHELCASYLKKAQIKHQQLIQAWMVAGKGYREKRRFVPCMSSFKNVMMALKDKNNLTYKEAQENWKICQIQYEDRY